jgi:hypothetical protein
MDPSLIGAPAPEPLLEEFTGVALDPPNKESAFLSHEFESASSCETFNSTVTSCGHSFAAELQASTFFYSASPSGGYSKASSRDSSSHTQKKSTSAGITTHYVANLYSFSIGRDKMILTEQARKDIRGIKTQQDAAKILVRYYSHFPSGLHHVGGIFMSSILIETESASSVKALLSKATDSTNASASAGGGNLAFNAAGGIKDSTFNDSSSTDSTNSEKKKCKITHNVKTYGPITPDKDAFLEALKNDESTWHIIDRGNSASLVAIWELVLQDGDPTVAIKAPLLRDTWLEAALKWKGVATPKMLVHIHNVQRLPLDAQLHHNLAVFKVAHEVSELIDKDSTFDIKEMSDNELADIVEKVFTAIYQHSNSLR